MFSNSSLLFASALVLAAQLATVASQGHNHTGHEDHPCQCEAKEQGWAIDCSDSTAMQARGCAPYPALAGSLLAPAAARLC